MIDPTDAADVFCRSPARGDFDPASVDVIEAVRTDRPVDYLKIIASLVPKELNVSASSLDDLLDDLSDEDLCDALGRYPGEPWTKQEPVH